jgi:uncharacterized membrane protein
MNKDNTATNDLYINSDESTSGKYERAITDVSANRISVGQLMRSAKSRKPSDIERAVYAHIRAMRTLGKKTINTAEIAEALSLSLGEVHGALGALKKKGVKVL